MAKARHYISIETLKTIYNTMLYPYLKYCSIIWTSTYPTIEAKIDIYYAEKKLLD